VEAVVTAGLRVISGLPGLHRHRQHSRWLGPPDSALILCVDEENPIQALTRKHPASPIGYRGPHARLRAPGFGLWQRRNGHGLVECKASDRYQEFLGFVCRLNARIRRLQAETPHRRESVGWDWNVSLPVPYRPISAEGTEAKTGQDLVVAAIAATGGVLRSVGLSNAYHRAPERPTAPVHEVQGPPRIRR
jgi:hypothetical protein